MFSNCVSAPDMLDHRAYLYFCSAKKRWLSQDSISELDELDFALQEIATELLSTQLRAIAPDKIHSQIDLQYPVPASQIERIAQKLLSLKHCQATDRQREFVANQMLSWKSDGLLLDFASLTKLQDPRIRTSSAWAAAKVSHAIHISSCLSPEQAKVFPQRVVSEMKTCLEATSRRLISLSLAKTAYSICMPKAIKLVEQMLKRSLSSAEKKALYRHILNLRCQEAKFTFSNHLTLSLLQSVINYLPKVIEIKEIEQIHLAKFLKLFQCAIDKEDTDLHKVYGSLRSLDLVLCEALIDANCTLNVAYLALENHLNTHQQGFFLSELNKIYFYKFEQLLEDFFREQKALLSAVGNLKEKLLSALQPQVYVTKEKIREQIIKLASQDLHIEKEVFSKPWKSLYNDLVDQHQDAHPEIDRSHYTSLQPYFFAICLDRNLAIETLTLEDFSQIRTELIEKVRSLKTAEPALHIEREKKSLGEKDLSLFLGWEGLCLQRSIIFAGSFFKEASGHRVPSSKPALENSRTVQISQSASPKLLSTKNPQTYFHIIKSMSAQSVDSSHVSAVSAGRAKLLLARKSPIVLYSDLSPPSQMPTIDVKLFSIKECPFDRKARFLRAATAYVRSRDPKIAEDANFICSKEHLARLGLKEKDHNEFTHSWSYDDFALQLALLYKNHTDLQTHLIFLINPQNPQDLHCITLCLGDKKWILMNPDGAIFQGENSLDLLAQFFQIKTQASYKVYKQIRKITLVRT